MGVYGKTYKSAFSGLGKPSIKLEFEDNDQLLAFQRRIDGGADGEEQGGAAYDPELANYDQKRLDEAVANHNTMGWGMSDELLDGWTRLHSDAAPKGYDVMIKGTRPALRLGTYGWEFRSLTDAQLVPKEKGLKAHKGGELEGAATDEETKKMRLALELASNAENIKSKPYSNDLLREEFGLAEKGGVYPIKTPLGVVSLEKSRFYENGNHILKHVGNNFNVIKRTLEDPYLVFQSFDGKSHPNIVFLKSFRLDGMILISVVSPVDPTVFNVKTVYEPDINHIWNLYKKGGEIDLYRKSAKDKVNRDTLNANLSGDAGLSFKFVGLRLPAIITKNGAKSFSFNENSLGAPGDLYLVRDMRTRSRKEPGELLANKNLKFEKQKNDTIKNFNKELYTAPTLANGNKEINGKTYYSVEFGHKHGDKDRYIEEVYLFIPKIYNASENKMRGSWRPFDVVIDADKLYNIERNPYGGGFQAYEDEATLAKNTNDALRQAFADAQRNVDYRKEQIEKEKNSPWRSNATLAKLEKYLKEAYKELKYFIMFYANYGKYSAWIMSDNNGGDYPVKMAEDIPEGYIDRSIFAANLAAPADDLGRAGASDALYNNNDIIDTRGLKPTYKILADYSHFFAPAQHAQNFAGVGLDDTKKLITNICNTHYKDCARIAQHLKADTKLQSVFNLWHWLRHNIRYEYDREGREEVRTPLRTWADRRRGVDCDCLSVFAWCVLKCMGYDPAFELVCFKGKKQPSHILVNLDGIRCDRVWFVFNALPPGVTNSEIYRPTDRATAAQLAGLFN